MKTLSLEMERGNPASRRRIETQLLHFDGRQWHGYSYRWNDDQTDATLVESPGADRTLNVRDPRFPAGVRTQTWHYPSRQECLLCHNSWNDYRLGVYSAATGRRRSNHPPYASGDYDARRSARRRMRTSTTAGPCHRWPRAAIVRPISIAAARSYLQVNCAHCHQFGAGGTAECRVSF